MDECEWIDGWMKWKNGHYSVMMHALYFNNETSKCQNQITKLFVTYNITELFF